MKKVFVLLMATAAMTACGIQYDLDADFPLEGEYWAVTGLRAPKGYQELNRLHFDTLPDVEDEGLLTSCLDFSGGKLTFTFPSGAYRTLHYTLDKNTKTISFDGVFIYGSYGSPDITSCKYKMSTLEDAKYVEFYDAKDPANVKIDQGEWSLTCGAMLEWLNEPLVEIEGMYGTTYIGNNIDFEDGPRWGYPVADGKAFSYNSKYDLGTIYWGPAWKLPSREDATFLKDNTTPVRVTNHAGEECIGFMNPDTRNALIFNAPEAGTRYGFWLEGGEAFVFSHDGKTVSVEFLQASDASALQLQVVPVKK